MNYDVNEIKLIYNINTLKISEDAFIKIDLIEKRGNKFFDVILTLKEREIFLGRFDKTFDKINAKYKDGKILIFYEEYTKETEKMEIIKILSLYEIIDDMFYSCSEKEALELFDKNIDSSYLKDKDNKIYREDVEKNRRLK